MQAAYDFRLPECYGGIQMKAAKLFWKKNEEWLVMVAIVVALTAFLFIVLQKGIKKEYEQESQAKYIKENCTLVKVNIADKRSHYRCADNLEYILKGLPEKNGS